MSGTCPLMLSRAQFDRVVRREEVCRHDQPGSVLIWLSMYPNAPWVVWELSCTLFVKSSDAPTPGPLLGPGSDSPLIFIAQTSGGTAISWMYTSTPVPLP